MPTFYAGQNDYIEQLNAMVAAGVTTTTLNNNTLAASLISLAVSGAAAFATLSATGQITSTVATGTAPFVVASTTAVANLNASLLGGATFAAPGAIGGTTPGSGAFTTLAASGGSTLTGSVGVGSAAFASTKMLLGGTAPASGTLSFGIYNGLSIDPTVTTSAYLNYTVPAVATGTTSALIHYYAAQGAFTGSVTNQYGFAVASTMTGGTANFAFHADLASGTGRYNFYAAGTAANFFQGETSFASQVTHASGTAGAPGMSFSADPDSGMYYVGSNDIRIGVDGLAVMRFASAASAVNFAYLYNAATGGGPTFRSTGSDTNIPLNLGSTGTGQIDFFTNSASTLQFRISNTTSAVNSWSVGGAATAGYPALYTIGSDANITGAFSSKGAAGFNFYSNTFANILFVARNVASSVNYLEFYPQATGASPIVNFTGSDATVNGSYNTRGTGSHIFSANNAVQMVVSGTASTVNWPVFTGSPTGSAVTISTNGTDTNRSMTLTAAGTGLVQISNDSLRIVTSKTPASAAATGTQGQIAWDASHIYVCTATDTWKRAAIATW